MRCRLPAILISIVLVAATVPRAQNDPPNVLLITIDTVRADRVGAYGFAAAQTPTLDRLAREGVRFADATTQAPLTGPAHAAILTGQYPARLGIRDNATTPIPAGTSTLATLLKARGYRTGGFVGSFVLAPEFGFAQGFDTYDATFQGFTSGMKLQVQRRCDDVADAAVKWIGSGNQPFFAWAHFYDAHAPYDPPPPFRARFRASPYDGEIAYVDSCMAKLVGSLERGALLDRTIVLVVADHGEGLGDHGESEHGMLLYDSVLRVPWIMRLPAHASAGAVVKAQVRVVDVMPTVAFIVGTAAPKVDGENIAPYIGGAPPRDPTPSYAETFYPKWHFGWSELKSIRVGDWKYVDAPKPELYDERADARELKNLIDSRGPLANGLSQELAKVQGSLGPAPNAEAPQPDPETLARLRSLGYVGVAAPSSGARGADPKDMLPKAEMFRAGISRALDALEHDRPDAAIPELKRLIEINDRSYELHLFLGDAYAAKKQWSMALGEYAAAKVLYPTSAAPLIAEARAYLASGDPAKALDALTRASALEPRSGEVALVRGMVYEQQRDAARALEQYQAAVQANGSDPRARVSLATLAMSMNQLDLAREQFETLLALGYRPSRMHYGLGNIAYARGDMKRAEAEYRLCLKLEPGFARAREALAKMGVSVAPAPPKR